MRRIRWDRVVVLAWVLLFWATVGVAVAWWAA